MKEGNQRFERKIPIIVDGEEKLLNPKEYGVLRILKSKDGVVGFVEFNEILGTDQDHALRAVISKLRFFIEPSYRQATFIQAVKGEGYILNDPEGKISLPDQKDQPEENVDS